MNLDETAEWLLQFALKVAKEEPLAQPFYAGVTTTAPAYAEVISKRVKKDNITPENIGEIMLAQIPSVSCVSAAAIMHEFKTMAVLLAALQSDPACLNAITTTNKNGQSKKLTKPCINAVYDFLVKKTVINVET
jgi:hypothetical protein